MKKIFFLLGFWISVTALWAQKPSLVVPSFHTAPLSVLKLSPNGVFMVTAGSDNMIKVWDNAKGKEIKSFPTGDDISAAAFSNDGQYLAASDKAHLYVIELKGMKLLHKIKTPYRAVVHAMDFAADSRSLLYGYNHDEHKKMEVHQINIDGSNDRLIFSQDAEKYFESYSSLSASPDGNYVLLLSYRKGNTLLNLRNLSDFKAAPNAQFFLPNNYLLEYQSNSPSSLKAIDPSNGTIKWQKSVTAVRSSKEHWTHKKFFVDLVQKNLSFSYINGDNEMMLVIDYTNGKAKEHRQFLTEKKLTQIAQIGEDWLLLAEGSKGMKIIDPKTKLTKKQFGQSILATSFMEGHPNVPTIVTGGFYNNEVKRIDFSNGRIKLQALKTKRGNDKIRLSTDGKITASVNTYDLNATVSVFDEGKLRRRIPMNNDRGENKLLNIALSADGSQLAVLYFEKLKLIDTKTGTILHTENMKGEFYKYSQGRIFFSTEDKLLIVFDANVTGSDRETIRCFSTKTKSFLWAKQFKAQNYYFKDASTLIATGYAAKKTYRIDATTGAMLSEKPLPGLVFSARETSYNLYQSQLAIEDEMDIAVFDIQTGRKKGTLSGASAQVGDLSFYQQDFLFSCGADNVIRLWDTKKMIALAQLIVYADSEDWALVSSDGRFDGSPNAIRQMYFTQGREFIPLEQLSEQFYTPNLLEQLLQREIEPSPIEIDDLISPPEVRLEYKAGQRNLVVEEDNPAEIMDTDKEEAIIEVFASSSKGQVEEIRLFHNGKILANNQRGLTVEDDEVDPQKLRFELKLLPGENSFRAIAINHQRTESAPALLVVNYKAKETSSAEPITNKKGLSLHLVVIGINEYKNRKYNLNYAMADAEAFKVAVTEGMKDITTDVRSYFVGDKNANKAGILKALNQVKSQASPQDILIFYYAGHGVMSEGMAGHKKDFYLVPHDVTQLYGADDALAQKGISATDLKELSASIAAQKQLFILDACQSAGAVETIAMRGAAEEKAIAQLARSTGTHWLTASGSEQYATEFAQLGHGVFTYALLEGLKGKADSGDKKVTVNELKAWIETQVPELTQQYKGTPQYPASYGYGQDFPIGVIR